MIETKIAACPFCGGNGGAWEGSDVARVHCDECSAKGPLGNTAADAIRLWNERGKIGNARVALVDPKIPIDTFKLLERLRESEDRLTRGDFGEVDRGVLLLMERRVLKVVPLRMADAELRDVATALISAIDAKMEMIR